VAWLQKEGLVGESARDVAVFLFDNVKEGLDYSAVGDYLGAGFVSCLPLDVATALTPWHTCVLVRFHCLNYPFCRKDFNNDVLLEYAGLLDLSGLHFYDALRTFLEGWAAMCLDCSTTACRASKRC
jgi:Sec7 domain-containing protein